MPVKFYKINTNNFIFNEYLITNAETEQGITFETDYLNIRKTHSSLNLILNETFRKLILGMEQEILKEFQEEFPNERGYLSSCISSSNKMSWINIENYQDLSYYNENKILSKPDFLQVNLMRFIFQVKSVKVFKNSSISVVLIPLQAQFITNYDNKVNLKNFAFKN